MNGRLGEHQKRLQIDAEQSAVQLGPAEGAGVDGGVGDGVGAAVGAGVGACVGAGVGACGAGVSPQVDRSQHCVQPSEMDQDCAPPHCPEGAPAVHIV